MRQTPTWWCFWKPEAASSTSSPPDEPPLATASCIIASGRGVGFNRQNAQTSPRQRPARHRLLRFDWVAGWRSAQGRKRRPAHSSAPAGERSCGLSGGCWGPAPLFNIAFAQPSIRKSMPRDKGSLKTEPACTACHETLKSLPKQKNAPGSWAGSPPAPRPAPARSPASWRRSAQCTPRRARRAPA